VTAGLRCLSLSSNNWMSAASSKQPTLPPKPVNAYALYVSDSFLTIKRNNPNMKAPQIMKLAAQEWKTLPAVKKGSYEQKVQQKMKDYTKALNMLTDEQKDDLEKQKKQARDARKVRKLRKELADLTSEKPKKLSGYQWFVQEKLKTMPSPMKIADLSVRCAALWKNLSATERMPYERMGEQSKKGAEAWTQKTIADGRAAKISEIKKKITELSD